RDFALGNGHAAIVNPLRKLKKGSEPLPLIAIILCDHHDCLNLGVHSSLSGAPLAILQAVQFETLVGCTCPVEHLVLPQMLEAVSRPNFSLTKCSRALEVNARSNSLTKIRRNDLPAFPLSDPALSRRYHGGWKDHCKTGQKLHSDLENYL